MRYVLHQVFHGEILKTLKEARTLTTSSVSNAQRNLSTKVRLYHTPVTEMPNRKHARLDMSVVSHFNTMTKTAHTMRRPNDEHLQDSMRLWPHCSTSVTEIEQSESPNEHLQDSMCKSSHCSITKTFHWRLYNSSGQKNHTDGETPRLSTLDASATSL